MRVAITLTFEPVVVLGPANHQTDDDGLMRLAEEFPPVVQFCGKFFKNGETKKIDVFETYEVRGAITNLRDICANDELVTPSPLDAPEREVGHATHIVGEWDADKSKNVVFKFGGCMFTGHIWSGCPCDCNKMAANIFTPHELGVDDAEEGSITTHQGVTIAWKRIKEEKDNETGTDRTHGCGHRHDDRLCVPE
jgi:hypothetical protein